jgi:hypothetical protein
MPMHVSVRGLPPAAASIKVDYQQGVKVEIRFKDQPIKVDYTLRITIPRGAAKDQIAMLNCEDLLEAQICNNLREDLQVILI